MAIRQEPNDRHGVTLLVERPGDLGLLPDTAAQVVSPLAVEMFRWHPNSLRVLAQRASLPGLEHALGQLADGEMECTLEVNFPDPDRAPGYRPEVYVRFYSEHGSRLDGAGLSGGVETIPSNCPLDLGEVLQLVGVSRPRYGAPEGLIAPDQFRWLPDLVQQYRRANPSAAPLAGLPEAPAAFFAFFEVGDEHMCTNPAGRTHAFSVTEGDYGAGVDIGDWLNGYFASGDFARLRGM